MNKHKVIVFGASGTVGQQVVRHALAVGCSVKAFVRERGRLALNHVDLTVVSGDASDEAGVSRHMADVDVVVSALSTYRSSNRLTFIKNIVRGMQDHSIGRIVVIGGIGALQASESLKVYQMADFPQLYVELSEAHVGVLNVLDQSSLDYTYVCPLFIPPGAQTGRYRVSIDYPIGDNIVTTGDLADFIVNEIDQNNFIRVKIGISSGKW